MTLPILVTGGTGRLGRRVVRRLVAAGCGIQVLTRHGRQAADGVQPAMNMAMARPGRRLSEGRNSVDGMSVDLLGRHERP
jgi:nucleoside-diphosphate-sugar epimerase